MTREEVRREAGRIEYKIRQLEGEREDLQKKCGHPAAVPTGGAGKVQHLLCPDCGDDEIMRIAT